MSEPTDRDVTALELCAYITGLLNLGAIPSLHIEGARARVKSLSAAYGVRPFLTAEYMHFRVGAKKRRAA